MEFTTEEPAHGPYDTVETVDETTINVGLSSDSEYGNTAADVYDSTGIIQESLDDSIVFQTTTEVACENEKADIDPAREMAHIKRRFVLEKVGHCNDETGVNVERAKRFIEAIGLHVEDSAHLIVKGDDIGMVTDTVVSVCNKPKTEDDVFDYIDELQLNIIWRPKMCPSSIEEEVVYGRVIASAAVQNELPPGSFEGKFLEVGFRRWVSRTYAHVTRHGRFGTTRCLCTPK
jgi:hypothetical protein